MSRRGEREQRFVVSLFQSIHSRSMFPTSNLFGHCPIYSTCINKSSYPPCLFSHSIQPPTQSTSNLPSTTTTTISIPLKRSAPINDQQGERKKSTIIVRNKVEHVASNQSKPPQTPSNPIASTSKLTSREITVDTTVNVSPLPPFF